LRRREPSFCAGPRCSSAPSPSWSNFGIGRFIMC
jgi:hypothetical protein